ncbi:MAG: biotin/lipoyl-containing protein, partial [Solirubrobacterales bacterium]
MAEIVMPRLSDSMEEGTVLKWLKEVGDEVAVGDELVEIETDKANMVYEADEAGTLSEIVADEGETLPIGQVIARVGEGAGSAETEAGGDGSAAEADTAGDGGNGGPPAEEAPASEMMESPSAAAPAPSRAEAAADPPPTQPSPTPAQESPPGRGGGDGRVKASPIAKRIASEKGVDISALSGSGPGGRIIKADVEAAPTTTSSQDGRKDPGAPPARAPLS